jgi:hypothetical protein
MATEFTSRPHDVSPGRLWFGVAGSAAAWFSLGLLDILLTWGACVHREQFGGASSHPGVRLLTIALTFSLLAIVLIAGTVSYRNWRQLSSEPGLQSAEGRGRQEFMALLGVFVSLTLAFSVFWLALPLFILHLCVRTR